ncbi:MAG TPA: ATP-binding protein [Pirellulaceae bacterium]|jgi:signal transduction histidine kinase|nr:ATP-binding protein [Pirellulaceae bacterium]
MAEAVAAAGSRRVLLLSPTRRDALVAQRILLDLGIESRTCESMDELCSQAEQGAGAALIAEERLRDGGTEMLLGLLDRQPRWSDLPIVVLLTGDELFPEPLARLNESANLTMVTRPLRIAAFVSAIRASLRDRGRQYAVRDFLAEREQASEKLREALAAASAANVAKSQFLANMSHEIRTPMTAVLGYAELLAERETDPEKCDFLDVIKRNGSFLLEIINDILDLSKIESGKLEIRHDRFSPQTVVEDVLSLMNVRAEEKGIELRLRFDGPIPETMRSDPGRLKQILVNLVGNAIKFTEEGEVRLTVGYADGASHRVRFRVTDTGIGMTADQIARLFRPFSQGDSSVTRSFGGTGLGLAISQRLAQMLGGLIEVASRPGRGSEFMFDLPLGDVGEVRLVTPREDSRLASSQTAPTLRLSCRVLVVDDRRDVRLLTRHILQRAGAFVEFAEDGVEALECVRTSLSGGSTFDAVLLDMQMPRLDGYQTAARLRTMGFRAPIIALTADAMQGDMDRCLANGCNAYLSKPIDAAQLVAAVAKFVC